MIIGTVNQTTDGNSWSVNVTELGPGTHNFTISDGTDSIFVDLFVTDTTLEITVIEPIYGGYRLHGVIQEGRTLIIAP